MKLVWDLTNKCNLRCKHCGAISLFNNEEIEIKDWKKVIDYVKKFVDSMILLGGEPLLHPDIDEIIKYANLNKIDVSVISNGQISRTTLYNIMKYDIGSIFISIEGLEDTNDKIRGNGTWKKSMESLDYLIKLNKQKINKTRIGVNIVANLLNHDEIVRFIDLTKQYKIVYQINYLTLVGNAQKNKKILEVTCEQLLTLYEEIADYHIKHPEIELDIRADYPIIFEYLNKKFGTNYSLNDLKCDALMASIYSDPYGNISPCAKYKKVTVNVNDNSKWGDDFFKFKPFIEFIHNNNFNDICIDCKYNEICVPCPLEEKCNPPDICLNVIEKLKKLPLPFDAKFKLNKPYNIVKSDEQFEVYYPNLGLQTEYSIEGMKILESIEEFKSLNEISREVSIPPDIVYKFLMQEKNEYKIIEKRD